MQRQNNPRGHGCPECGGRVDFFARHCRFCKCKITFFDRYEWADDWAKISLLIVAMGFGSLIGYFLFHIDKPTLSLLIAVVICCWYGLRVAGEQRAIPTVGE